MHLTRPVRKTTYPLKLETIIIALITSGTLLTKRCWSLRFVHPEAYFLSLSVTPCNSIIRNLSG